MKEILNKNTKMKQVENNVGVGLEEKLRQLYVDEHKSINQIAQILQISYATAFHWLKKAGIYSRKLKSL